MQCWKNWWHQYENNLLFFQIGQILEREKSTHYLIILDSAPKNVILVDDNTHESYKDVIVAKKGKNWQVILFYSAVRTHFNSLLLTDLSFVKEIYFYRMTDPLSWTFLFFLLITFLTSLSAQYVRPTTLKACSNVWLMPLL